MIFERDQSGLMRTKKKLHGNRFEIKRERRSLDHTNGDGGKKGEKEGRRERETERETV